MSLLEVVLTMMTLGLLWERRSLRRDFDEIARIAHRAIDLAHRPPAPTRKD